MTSVEMAVPVSLYPATDGLSSDRIISTTGEMKGSMIMEAAGGNLQREQVIQYLIALQLRFIS